MIRPWGLIWRIIYPTTYIWVEVIYVRETKKAILIEFDDRKRWIPKAWIARIQRNGGRSIKIKMSDYDWTKKFI
jgi:hypothetical protein